MVMVACVESRNLHERERQRTGTVRWIDPRALIVCARGPGEDASMLHSVRDLRPEYLCPFAVNWADSIPQWWSSAASVPAFSRAKGVFATPGYPSVPALFVAVSLLILGSVVWTNPLRSGAGFVLIGLGVPAYLFWSRRLGDTSTSDTERDDTIADPTMLKRFPATWAPYMTWAKHHVKTRYDLTGSNLLPCTLDELPGARESLDLYGRNDDGWPPLVEAIAQRYGIDASRVATAPGASGANFLALAALVRPGDTVLVEWPGYDPQGGAARFLSARVNTFERGWDDSFALNPERVESALTPDTRAVLVTNLHNPSGAYAEADALHAVGDLARSVGAKVIVDEVYLDALSGVDRSPAATRDDVFISTNSLTKSYGLAGLRVGWMVADPGTVERALRVRDVVDAVGSIPSELLGVLAFQQLDALLERARGVLGPGQAIARDFIASRPELDWVQPLGGAVAFPRLVGVDDAEPFVEMAAARFHVGVTPGHFFGAPEHFRVAVAGERSVLEHGLAALGKALDRGLP